MYNLRLFDINISGLGMGVHTYEFDINDEFFKHFDYSIIRKGVVKICLSLNKAENFIDIGFDMEGKIELECDRSLEFFYFPFSKKEKIIFKFGEEYKELSEEIIVIPKNTEQINIAKYIYEFIVLSIPMKKLHPKYILDSEEDLSEDKLIYTSQANESAAYKPDNTEEADPRWDTLRNI